MVDQGVFETHPEGLSGGSLRSCWVQQTGAKARAEGQGWMTLHSHDLEPIFVDRQGDGE